MQRVTALLRSSCSASIAGNIRWSAFGGVTAGGFSASVIWAAALLSPRRRAAGMLGWWCGGGRVREKGGSILRGLTACCTCPPPIIMQLTLRRRTLHPQAGFVHKFRNEAQTMQRHDPSRYTPKKLWFMLPHVLLRGNRFKFASVNKTKTETQARRDTTVALHLLPELIRNNKNKWLDSLYLTHELYIKVKLEQMGLKKALQVPQVVWGFLK